VIKKQRLKKKKRQAPTPLSADEERLLDSLLENLDKINPDNIKEHIKGPDVARSLLERLPPDDPASVNLILTLREAFPEREVQKAVKRTAFRFGQKGISIPDKEEVKGPSLTFKNYESAGPSAYVSPIDWTGSRGVLILIPQTTKGMDVGLGTVNSEEGITDFIYGNYSKKSSRELKEIFFRQAGMEIETSLSHAATILERSFRKNEIKAGEPAADYLNFRPWILKNITLLESPVIYDFINPDSMTDEALTEERIKRLLDQELMRSWVIGPEKLEPVLKEISETKDSLIIISEAQQADRIKEIKEKALRDLYPGSKRVLVKEELEEMAYIFFRLDQEEYARLCLASASSMDEEDSTLRTNLFLKVLLDRSVALYLDIMEKKDLGKGTGEDSSPNIILP